MFLWLLADNALQPYIISVISSQLDDLKQGFNDTGPKLSTSIVSSMFLPVYPSLSVLTVCQNLL